MPAPTTGFSGAGSGVSFTVGDSARSVIVKSVQQFENCFMHAAQGLAHGAVFGLIAGSVFGKAVRQDHRAVDRANHFEGADPAGVAREFIAAVGAGDRLQNAGAGQLLQHFGQQRHGQVIGVGDILRAGGRTRNGGEMPQGDQPVIRFFGQLEHWINSDLSGP